MDLFIFLTGEKGVWLMVAEGDEAGLEPSIPLPPPPPPEEPSKGEEKNRNKLSLFEPRARMNWIMRRELLLLCTKYSQTRREPVTSACYNLI